MSRYLAINAKRVMGHDPRAPKQRTEESRCGQEDCDVKLSRYNRGEFCWAHTPKERPRTRGRDVR